MTMPMYRPAVVSGMRFFSAEAAEEPVVEEAAPISAPLRTTSTAKHRNIRYPQRKLNDVCRLVRGLNADEALNQMKLNPKKGARFLYSCIRNARTAAINNFDLDSSRLVVSEAYVGRATPKPFRRSHAKGRFVIAQHPRSHLYVVLEYVAKEEGEVRLGRFGRKNSTIERTLERIEQYHEKQAAALE